MINFGFNEWFLKLLIVLISLHIWKNLSKLKISFFTKHFACWAACNKNNCTSFLSSSSSSDFNQYIFAAAICKLYIASDKLSFIFLIIFSLLVTLLRDDWYAFSKDLGAEIENGSHISTSSFGTLLIKYTPSFVKYLTPSTSEIHLHKLGPRFGSIFSLSVILKIKGCASVLIIKIYLYPHRATASSPQYTNWHPSSKLRTFVNSKSSSEDNYSFKLIIAFFLSPPFSKLE